MPKSIGRRGLRRSEPERPSVALRLGVIDDREVVFERGLPTNASNPGMDARPERDSALVGGTARGSGPVGGHPLDLRKR